MEAQDFIPAGEILWSYVALAICNWITQNWRDRILNGRKGSSKIITIAVSFSGILSAVVSLGTIGVVLFWDSWQSALGLFVTGFLGGMVLINALRCTIGLGMFVEVVAAVAIYPLSAFLALAVYYYHFVI